MILDHFNRATSAEITSLSTVGLHKYAVASMGRPHSQVSPHFLHLSFWKFSKVEQYFFK